MSTNYKLIFETAGHHKKNVSLPPIQTSFGAFPARFMDKKLRISVSTLNKTPLMMPNNVLDTNQNCRYEF